MRKKIDRRRFETPYRLRKQVVEPVFGQIKQARGFRQFLLRGVENVRGRVGHDLHRPQPPEAVHPRNGRLSRLLCDNAQSRRLSGRAPRRAESQKHRCSGAAMPSLGDLARNRPSARGWGLSPPRLFHRSAALHQPHAVIRNRNYFVDGVTESLTTDLSRISGSFVIGPSHRLNIQRQSS